MEHVTLAEATSGRKSGGRVGPVPRGAPWARRAVVLGSFLLWYARPGVGDLVQQSRAIAGSRAPRRRVAWLVLLPSLLLGADVAAPDRFDTVVIDAGHGGSDTGAHGSRGTLEKDVVLHVARSLAERLRAGGLRVVMTRESDVYVSLERRNAVANDARADLFLSIHANAADDADVRGTETYFLALDASDEGAAQVASRENRAFGGEGAADIQAVRDPFIALVGDLITSEYMEDSSAFARKVQSELAGVEPLRSRGVKQAMFVVLHGVQMPAALVEIGFVTNARDERTLATKDGRGHVVEALERAVHAYGRRHDARRGVTPPANGDRSGGSGGTR
jgi:N-acetylmuramoyl-L-alanine amidase